MPKQKKKWTTLLQSPINRVLSCCYCDKLQQRPDELGVTIRRKLDIFEITCEMYHYERTLLGIWIWRETTPAAYVC